MEWSQCALVICGMTSTWLSALLRAEQQLIKNFSTDAFLLFIWQHLSFYATVGTYVLDCSTKRKKVIERVVSIKWRERTQFYKQGFLGVDLLHVVVLLFVVLCKVVKSIQTYTVILEWV